MILPPDAVRTQALALEGRDRLVSLLALRLVFPLLAVDLDWGDAIRETRAGLAMGKGEEQALAERVRLTAAELRRQLGRRR
jgi:hypothetical protein